MWVHQAADRHATSPVAADLHLQQLENQPSSCYCNHNRPQLWQWPAAVRPHCRAGTTVVASLEGHTKSRLISSHSMSKVWIFFFSQMKLCMDEFRSLASRYADLHQASFDADYATLRNVELYPLFVWQPVVSVGTCLQCQLFHLNCWLSQQQSCLLVSHVIEALILDPQTARWVLINSCLKRQHDTWKYVDLCQQTCSNEKQKLLMAPFVV